MSFEFVRDLLQESERRGISRGHGGKEPIVFKIRLKKRMKSGPGQTEPVAGADSSEEQLQVEVNVDASSNQSLEEETQPISNQTDPTPHVKTSVKEEEVEKLSEDTVDVASTQNTEEEMQQISEQSDSTIALLQESEMREISQGYGGKEPDQAQTKKGRSTDLLKPSHMCVSLKMVLTRSWRRRGLLLREMLNSR